MNIYVGNLSPRTTESQLFKAFEMYGKVDKVSLDIGPPNGAAYGFCFVTMPFDNQALRAIKQLHGKIMSGNTLTVKESGVGI